MGTDNLPDSTPYDEILAILERLKVLVRENHSNDELVIVRLALRSGKELIFPLFHVVQGQKPART